MNAEEFNKLIADKDNIIFDFGGIFVDIQYNDTIEELTKLSTELDAAQFYSKKSQVSFFSDLETGKITQDEFIVLLKDHLKIERNDTEIIKAWNAMLKEIRVERLVYLRELKKTKKVFMLSNINEIHEKYLDLYIKERPELAGFYDEFDKVYFSHNIGERKPNAKAYETVLKENDLDIKRTLFIDDSPQHVEGALKIGLDAVLLDPPNSFITGL
tara:strand:+ start:241371 stop:242012 length:642 start_codon:yes stop_codon:yes gene_type:complete